MSQNLILCIMPTFLRLLCRMLEQKLAEAKSKKDTLKARAKSATASKQITDMIQGLNTSNALTAFEKMEEKVMALESESEATLQVWLYRRRGSSAPIRCSIVENSTFLKFCKSGKLIC